MSVKASRSKLEKSTKNLLIEWEEAKNSWRDAKSLEFEKNYLAGMTDTVVSTARSIGKIDDLLGKIRRDCE